MAEHARPVESEGEQLASPVQAPTLEERGSPELVFGMTGPVGSGVSTTGKLLARILQRDYGYEEVHQYRVSTIITECAKLLGQLGEMPNTGADRIENLQTIGNRLRETFSANYLAEKCVEKIAVSRLEGGYSTTSPTVPLPRRRAHIIDSLKNPAEVRLLRDVYGDVFWHITVFAPEGIRERRLQKMGILQKDLGSIMSRDENEDFGHGQKVRDTSYLADFLAIITLTQQP